MSEAGSVRPAADNGKPVPPRRLAPQVGHLRRILLALLVAVVLYTCYFAASLLLPVLIAVFTAILLNPIVRLLGRLWIPRWLAAALVMSAGLGTVVAFGMFVYEPAREAARDAPAALRQIAPKLREMTRPIEEASRVSEALEEMQTTQPQAQRVRVVESSNMLRDALGIGAQPIAGILTAVILLYFFLVYGETLLRRAVTIVPTLADKRLTVEIVRSIQTDMSRYMLTITVINIALGLATAAALWWLGVPDPLLWGGMAGLLNYAPYLGPAVMALILGAVGLFTFDDLGAAMLPAAAFLGINLLEGQFITPLALGSSLALNPVIILMWLMFWGWMWGIPGFLLGVPMLVCFKIVCSRIEALRSWSLLLEK